MKYLKGIAFFSILVFLAMNTTMTLIRVSMLINNCSIK